MKTSALILLLWSATGLLVNADGTTRPEPQAIHLNTLDALIRKTGWIRLGDLTPDLKRWASSPDPNVNFFSGGFEIIGRNIDRREAILPKIGDRIRLTVSNRVVIVDYGKSGEERALDSPTTVVRPLGPNDRTQVVLDPGTVVHVEDVQISPAYGNIKFAWARVSP